MFPPDSEDKLSDFAFTFSRQYRTEKVVPFVNPPEVVVTDNTSNVSLLKGSTRPSPRLRKDKSKRVSHRVPAGSGAETDLD